MASISRAARALSLAALAGVLITTIMIAPARAGQDVLIELKNDLPKTQPLYPRLALRGTDYYCWYSDDFDSTDIAAPAGGGFASYHSEVKNSFFSFCSGTFSPFKDANARWQEFQLVSQSTPGAAWQPITWDDKDYSKFLLSYWKIVNDVRGFHFDLTGPPATTALKTPVGKACLTIDPRMFNYGSKFSMTVSKADGDTCEAAPGAERSQPQVRNIRLNRGESRTILVGPVTGGPEAARWRARSGQCTSDHFRVGRTLRRGGPGDSRWQVVKVRGTSAGQDTCLVDLMGSRGQRLMTQRMDVTVR